MNESEKEILLSKAALGDLTPEEKTLWENICESDPALREEADELRKVSTQLEAMIESVDTQAEEMPSEPLPESARNRLEEARKSIFSDVEEVQLTVEPPVQKQSSGQAQQPQQTHNWWRDASEKLSKWTSLPAPALAAAAVVTVGLVSVGVLQFGGPTSDPAIIMKAPVVSPDLTILSPGEKTALLDPTVMWQVFPVEPADVSFYTADGEKKLFSAKGKKVKVLWKDFEAVQDAEDNFLKTGESYLLRIAQGDLVSERIVTVSERAKASDDWEDTGALETARQWLDEGSAEDALMLAAKAAANNETQKSTADFTEIRTKSLQLILQKTRSN